MNPSAKHGGVAMAPASIVVVVGPSAIVAIHPIWKIDSSWIRPDEPVGMRMARRIMSRKEVCPRLQETHQFGFVWISHRALGSSLLILPTWPMDQCILP